VRRINRLFFLKSRQRDPQQIAALAQLRPSI
jgi:hypothetical protein